MGMGMEVFIVQYNDSPYTGTSHAVFCGTLTVNRYYLNCNSKKIEQYVIYNNI